MAKFAKTVDSCLAKMHEVGGTGKGVYGEKSVLSICEQLYQKNGGILYHSYTYKLDPSRPGNIKIGEQGNFFIEPLGTFTEIDVLYVSPYRIFPIEVKAYKSKMITLTDERISGCYKTDKSPVHQNEMHCRHLYEAVYRALPDGRSEYIVPIVVFVDQCTLVDKRAKWQKDYIKVIPLDHLLDTIITLDKPLNKKLDLSTVGRVLNEGCIKSEACLPLRIK